MTNKTLVLTCLTVLALGTTAYAEGRDGKCGGKGFGGGHVFEKLDANSDDKVSKQELHSDIQRRFAEFDTNKDGKVNAAEVQSRFDAKRADVQGHIAERMTKADKNADGKWTKDELSKMPEQFFTKLDKDSNGVLTKSELEAGRDFMKSHRGGFMEKVFARADVNSDGAIDGPEALRLAEGRFDAIDTNHDGFVARDEWKSGRKGHGGHKGHHRDHKSAPKGAAGQTGNNG